MIEIDIHVRATQKLGYFSSFSYHEKKLIEFGLIFGIILYLFIFHVIYQLGYDFLASLGYRVYN